MTASLAIKFRETKKTNQFFLMICIHCDAKKQEQHRDIGFSAAPKQEQCIAFVIAQWKSFISIQHFKSIGAVMLIQVEIGRYDRLQESTRSGS